LTKVTPDFLLADYCNRSPIQAQHSPSICPVLPSTILCYYRAAINLYQPHKHLLSKILQVFIMRIIRWILSVFILFFDWLFTPRGIKRAPEVQASIDQQTEKLALYQYKACPFCVKVRRAMKRQSLSINTHDPRQSTKSHEELIKGGGKLKVPCLRIEEEGETRWMYESSDIINYLNSRFGSPSS
jgi:glutaredoxin